ncbi:MAG: LysM peptidoglycan-binding domain-containing protein [Pontiellaceae bacterium]|nr:LysM peptidoglycan-binding domain-containing protein [Pontiellaceae bacterium]
MKMKMVVLSLVSVMVLSGCETLQSTNQRTTQTQNASITRYVSEMDRRTNSKLETMSAENSRLQQQVQQLSAELRASNNQIAQLSSNMNALQAQYKREMANLVAEVNNRLRDVNRTPSGGGSSGSTVSGRVHTVESGHTLSTIAQAYGSTVKAIKEANNLKSDVIIVGQKLIIPD